MGRKSAAAKPGQDERENQQLEGVLTQEAAPDSVRDASEVTRETAGPEGPEELLGCQEDGEDAAELAEGVLLPYAVTAAGGLRLRLKPSVDAPIVAELPYGAGVYADECMDGWLHVRTGRLEGYMMAMYLEALPLPELRHVRE